MGLSVQWQGPEKNKIDDFPSGNLVREDRGHMQLVRNVNSHASAVRPMGPLVIWPVCELAPQRFLIVRSMVKLAASGYIKKGGTLSPQFTT